MSLEPTLMLKVNGEDGDIIDPEWHSIRQHNRALRLGRASQAPRHPVPAVQPTFSLPHLPSVSTSSGYSSSDSEDSPHPPVPKRSWSEGSSLEPEAVPSSGAVALAAMCGAWYLTGAFTNSSSKQALSALPTPLPLTLTLVQHAAASLFGSVAYRALALRPYKPLPSSASLERPALRALVALCIVYTTGFFLTNASFGAVNASFVDTVKAGEPITTVLLASLFMPNERASLAVIMALLPIVGGVGISSMAEASASLVGLAFAFGANLCFSARSIAAKLVSKHVSARAMDGGNLFVHVNRLGLLALAPAVAFFEGRHLLDLADKVSSETLVAAARLFAFNGLMYYCNNQLNFLVLEKVDALTHGVINSGRRVTNILFAIMWFGNKVNLFNGVGISLALFGGFLYVQAKRTPPTGAKKVQ